MNQLKEILFQHCQRSVRERLQRIQQTIADQQEALASETKISAGDKHETGRALLHLEREKTGMQLAATQQLQQVLAKIDPKVSTSRVSLGSLVYTSSGIYYMSISIGKLKIDDITYIPIAINTPIGKALVGQSVGYSFIFQNKNIKILDLF